MENYVYLMANHDRSSIHAGYCNDLREMLNVYEVLNEMCLVPFKKLNTLVYLEEVNTEGHAIDRISYFTFIPIKMKIKEIEEVNPGWIDLTTASNFNF